MLGCGRLAVAKCDAVVTADGRLHHSDPIWCTAIPVELAALNGHLCRSLLGYEVCRTFGLTLQAYHLALQSIRLRPGDGVWSFGCFWLGVQRLTLVCVMSQILLRAVKFDPSDALRAHVFL